MGVLLLPALGGLFRVCSFAGLSPAATGQGRRFNPRVSSGMGACPFKALGRPSARPGVISCGGSTGPEGPTAALGAAIGSTVVGLFRLYAARTRILLVAGCARASARSSAAARWARFSPSASCPRA